MLLLLIVAAVCAIAGVVGLVGLIDEAIVSYRQGKQERARKRLLMRQNINELIVALTEHNSDTLDRALQESIIEYRVLS